MKEKAKKTLLFLYVRQQDPYFFATQEMLEIPMDTLTPAGRRSLLTLLINRKYIAMESALGKKTYRLSSVGAQALKTALPALYRSESTWTGKWTCLVFKEAPTGDAQFRYLRTLLVKYQSVTLARGVYLYPDHFPAAIHSEVEKRYQSAVSLFEIGNWLTDDERHIAIENYQLSDLLQSYSGISSEIVQLINRKKVDNELTQQDKLHLSSLFSRLYEIITTDMGLLRYYFPQAKSGNEVLIEFQHLCRHMFSQEGQ